MVVFPFKIKFVFPLLIVALLAAGCSMELKKSWNIGRDCDEECAKSKDSKSLPSGISGMAAIDDGVLLVVHDTKGDREGPRVGVIQFADSASPVYHPVSIDWSGYDWPSSDLESASQVPGEQGLFLLAESGYWKGRYGRVFRMRLENDGGTWSGMVEGHYMLPEETDNIEGMAAVRAEEETLLILAERGGSDKNPQCLLRLFRIGGGTDELIVMDEQEFAAPGWTDKARNRDCSDIMVDDMGKLWISSTDDPGDNGPFRSIIYEAGAVNLDGPLVTLLPVPEERWRLDGLKVEAIGPPMVGNSGITVGTDDEVYGGILRPLDIK